LSTDENRKKPAYNRFDEPLGRGPYGVIHVFKSEDAARAWLRKVVRRSLCTALIVRLPPELADETLLSEL
jgi:hypothetical protein